MPAGRMYKYRSGKAGTLAKLSRKVSRNTRILGQREIGRVQQDMGSTPDTTAQIQNVSLTSTGDDISSRDGRKIHAVSIEISGTVAKSTTASFSLVRLLLVRDNFGTTVPPIITDIFADEADFFNGLPRLKNPQKMKRFTIYWDKMIVLNEAFDGNVSAKHFKFKKRLNFDIYYSGASNTDEGKNSLWLIQASDEGTNKPALDGGFVMEYTDL